MLGRDLTLAAVVLLVTSCETGGPRAKPTPETSPPPELPIEEQVKILAGKSRPGPRHAALAPLAGTWDVVVSNLSSEGHETELFPGRATLSSILGGRFLRWEESIDFKGTPATTTGFLGFDSRLDEYELLMISDLAQGMEVSRGNGDLAGSGLVLTLEQLDPRTGTRVRSRSRIRILAADHFVLEQLEPDASGGERAGRVWHHRRAPPSTR